MTKGTSTANDHGGGALAALHRHWIAWTLVAWIVVAAYFLYDYRAPIRWWALGDTDDNMRLMQVRALLGGQGWFDLRQYRMNPPTGLDIHWTRLVDLPIAGLIVVLRQVATPAWAERTAIGVAPLLPLALAMVASGATVRRLVDPRVWPLAIVMLLSMSVGLYMFMPLRIDHHGWQLALLAATLAGLCDPRGGRGGATVGIASALSLTIGLEMLPYIALAGVILALRWTWDRADAVRLQVYALTFGGGSALGFAAFASYANRAPRCDALTPVWLSVAVVAGAALFAMARANPQRAGVRLALAAAAGLAIAVGFALVFPQCLGRPEQVSPELARNWLDNVREARPLYKHPFRTAFPIVALPVAGLIGALVATWRARRAGRLVEWAGVLLFQLFALAMLFWQARAGPAAQLLAVPGATALAWLVLPWLRRQPTMAVRVLGTAGAFLLVSGTFAGALIYLFPIDRPSAYTKRVNRATGECVRTTRLWTLNRYPAQTVFTFVDLGPRLIAMTHHDAVAGPYHRNGAEMLDVQHAFSRSPAEARAIMHRHRATLLLLCPDMAESTLYRARTKTGFYSRLARGERFAWLTPLPLPRGAPYRLFRIG